MARRIRIGTRGSKLALYQTRLTQKALSEANQAVEFEVIRIQTTQYQIRELCMFMNKDPLLETDHKSVCGLSAVQ